MQEKWKTSQTHHASKAQCNAHVTSTKCMHAWHGLRAQPGTQRECCQADLSARPRVWRILACALARQNNAQCPAHRGTSGTPYATSNGGGNAIRCVGTDPCARNAGNKSMPAGPALTVAASECAQARSHYTWRQSHLYLQKWGASALDLVLSIVVEQRAKG